MRNIEDSADFSDEDEILERLLSKLPSINDLQEERRKEVEAEHEAERTATQGPPPFDPKELEKRLLEQIIDVGEQQGKIHNMVQGFKIIQDQQMASTITIPGVVFAVDPQPWKDQLEFWERLEPELAQRMIVLCQKYLDRRARDDRASDTIQEIVRSLARLRRATTAIEPVI